MRVVRIADDRLLQRQRDAADVVHLEVVNVARVRERMHVEHFHDRADLREHGVRRLLEQVLALRRERLLVEPAEVRVELLRRLRRVLAQHEGIAARDVDVLRQANRHRLARERAVDLRGAARHRRDDFLDRRFAVGRQHDNGVADLHFTRFDAAHIAAEVVGLAAVLARDPLHREAQRVACGRFDRQRLEHVEQPLAATMLSPFNADTGTKRTPARPSWRANSTYASRISLKRVSLNSTRSILLIATITCCRPSSLTIALWRLVCGRSTAAPFSNVTRVASTRMIAACAVDAPVTMLRVYCSWPGVSAMMNLRLAVAK